MKLYLIIPIIRNAGPWKCWYDKVFGFVVRAKSAKEARSLCAQQAADEGAEVWLDKKLTSCKVLYSNGPSLIILKEVHWA